MSNRLRLILFDVDGTLLDSQTHIHAATAIAFEGAGRDVPSRAAVRAGVGLSVENALHRLAPDADAMQLEALSSTYRAAFMNLATNGSEQGRSPLFEGVERALRGLAEMDWTLLGVVTGKSRRGLERMMVEHNLGGLFQTIQVADGHPSKPHPSMALTAMAEMGVLPDQTVVIGDTTYDMLMAKAAGVPALGVSWGYHPAQDLLDAGAALVLDSFDALEGALAQIERG